MTGYGEHRTKIAGSTIICRIRSLNHRFLDLKLRLPRSDLLSLDMAIRKRIGEVFKRGSIEITVSVESGRETNDASINTKLAEAYSTAAKALAKKLKLTGPGLSRLSIDVLMRMPGKLLPRIARQF